MKYTRKHIFKAVKDAGCDIDTAREVLQVIEDIIHKKLTTADKLELRGIGAFKPVLRKARRYVDHNDGGKVKMSEDKIVIKFIQSAHCIHVTNGRDTDYVEDLEEDDSEPVVKHTPKSESRVKVVHHEVSDEEVNGDEETDVATINYDKIALQCYNIVKEHGEQRKPQFARHFPTVSSIDLQKALDIAVSKYNLRTTLSTGAYWLTLDERQVPSEPDTKVVLSQKDIARVNEIAQEDGANDITVMGYFNEDKYPLALELFNKLRETLYK